ncbi:hypothetical protein, unlikely [Trypanosoma brucei gambiense DAL972]|uniref:Uncharacterized protein n=1 Tax=Trypanosoma brucei gambiense (strain MHOM/CI/86/DAL972) TaxID=679716 RepID=C9ZNG1_TRYB9|nr:hypothetical protein, unlikely [Trypanosoma brucei gambiense DAL972]CBH10939.1 hypothetical protein, unlikely [Trypanosoma brucei gambiense DAL972]|eukprot:XP_011773226.1 hypothetical protein, unlikely [Trypanosoma brucei gambiense DAL972]
MTMPIFVFNVPFRRSHDRGPPLYGDPVGIYIYIYIVHPFELLATFSHALGIKFLRVTLHTCLQLVVLLLSVSAETGLAQCRYCGLRRQRIIAGPLSFAILHEESLPRTKRSCSKEAV